MSISKSVLPCLILLFVTNGARAGEFTLSKYCESPEPCSIDYTGDIKIGDVGNLEQVLARVESRRNFDHQLNLDSDSDSDGGDVAVALKLGHLIRHRRLTTSTEDAEKAKRLEISKQEYLNRKHQMMILCDDNRNVVMADHTGEALHRCRNEVLEGRFP